MSDGTIRWGMFVASSDDEPTSVDVAMKNPKWVAAMDIEHSALIKNKTWHLILKGRMSLIVSGYIKSKGRRL